MNRSIGWINLIRADVKKATDECISTRRLNKDYSVLWWFGRARNIPFHLVHGVKQNEDDDVHASVR